MATRKTAEIPDHEVMGWIEERRKRHKNDQLADAAEISVIFESVTKGLPPAQSAIFNEILLHCGESVQPKEIANATGLSCNTVTTMLGKMVRAKIVRQTGQGLYGAAYDDFQRVHAVYHNPAWAGWAKINQGLRKPGHMVDAFLHFQRTMMHAYFERFFKCREDIALLANGAGAAENLKLLYEKATREGYSTLWVEYPGDGSDFWEKTSSAIALNREERMNICAHFNDDAKKTPEYFEASLKASGRQNHLFLPYVDKIFHSNETRAEGNLGAPLRRIWQTNQIHGKHLLNIYGSAENPNSAEYLTTFGDQKFRFYEGCWLRFDLEPIIWGAHHD